MTRKSSASWHASRRTASRTRTASSSSSTTSPMIPLASLSPRHATRALWAASFSSARASRRRMGCGTCRVTFSWERGCNSTTTSSCCSKQTSTHCSSWRRNPTCTLCPTLSTSSSSSRHPSREARRRISKAGFLQSRSALHTSAALRRFSAVDAEGSGFVSYADFQKVLSESELELQDQALITIMRKYHVEGTDKAAIAYKDMLAHL
mmetsp:Transcript_13093/g.34930  ORF Transcript_13093/g.34930 Transcript_13093/m.34930 type:complete len:207 (-) Transcript_13093:370-990(-)